MQCLITCLFSSTSQGRLPGHGWGGSMGAAWWDRPRGQRGQTSHPWDRHWQGKPSSGQSSHPSNSPSTYPTIHFYSHYPKSGIAGIWVNCVSVKNIWGNNSKLMMSIFHFWSNPTWITLDNNWIPGWEDHQEGDSGQLEHVCRQPSHQLRGRSDKETRRAVRKTFRVVKVKACWGELGVGWVDELWLDDGKPQKNLCHNSVSLYNNHSCTIPTFSTASSALHTVYVEVVHVAS